MKTAPQLKTTTKWRQPQNEDNCINENDPKNEENLEYEDNAKNKRQPQKWSQPWKKRNTKMKVFLKNDDMVYE